MNINVLREFVRLSKNLNFTITAKQCYITQSVLSKHISSLESEIGVALFIRSRSRVRLTAVGREFAADVENLLKLYDSALKKVMASKYGAQSTLKVAFLQRATQSFLLPACGTFLRENADVDLALRVMEGDSLLKAVEGDEADVALTMTFDQVNTVWYDYYQVFDDFYGIVLSVHHPLAIHDSLSVKDLAGMVAVVPNREFFQDEWSYLNHRLTEAISDVVVLDIVNTEADFSILPLVKDCFAVVPSHMRFALNPTQLKFVSLHDLYLHTNICAVWKKSRATQTIQSFIDVIDQTVSKMGTDILRNQVGDFVLPNDFDLEDTPFPSDGEDDEDATPTNLRGA